MERRGTIFTYSIVHSGIEAFQEMTPYVLAVVEEDRQRRLARVVGYMDRTIISVGMEVSFLAEDENGNPIYRFA